MSERREENLSANCNLSWLHLNDRRLLVFYDFVSDDASGRVVLDRVITDTQQGVESIYEQLIADDPALATQEVTFDVTGGAISVGGSNADINAYPETDDWQKAIGAHTVWASATVTVTPGEDPDNASEQGE